MGSKLRRRFVRCMATTVLAFGLVAGGFVRPAIAASATYSQPVLFEWDRHELDVLIVPPHHGQLLNGRSGTRALNGGDVNELNPLANSYLKALTRAITGWREAIATFGSRSLRKLRLHVYVLGRDLPPSAALRDPEILFTWDETKGAILGLSARYGEESPCVVSNSMLALNSFSSADMYNIAGHEFGHCLGINHAVGPKGIKRDLLYAVYGQNIGLESNTFQCMSNLNVKALELVYDGRETPDVAKIAVRDYKQIRCGQGR